MWCSRLVLRPLSPAAMHCQQLSRCSRQLSAHALNSRPTSLTLAHRSSISSLMRSLRRPYLPSCSALQQVSITLHVRTLASQRNKQRGGLNATSTAASTQSPSSTPPASPPPVAPYDSSSYHSSLPSSSPADSGRLIYATTLTLYARGVPYLFLFLLLPVVCYSIYATYEPSTTASAPGSANSYLSLLPLTVLPLSFLLLVAAFVRFNRRLVATIHLLPDRRVALTTVNMLPASSSSTPHFIMKQLDTLLPPFAWTGSQDRTLHRLRFVREGEAGGVDEYWLYAAPSKAGQQGVELLRRIMTDNRLSSRDLAM